MSDGCIPRIRTVKWAGLLVAPGRLEMFIMSSLNMPGTTADSTSKRLVVYPPAAITIGTVDTGTLRTLETESLRCGSSWN